MSDPHVDADQDDPRSGRPARKWIVATVVLAATTIGLGALALSLRSDIQDKDAQIAAQQKKLDEQKDLVGQVREAAGGFADEARQALGRLGAELEQLQGAAAVSQAETQKAIDSAEQAAAEAGAKADKARDAIERARARAAEAAARGKAVAACARGYLSALAGAFDAASIKDGVAQASADIEALKPSCSGVLGS
jgi:chromosome segregation ATPase